MELLSTCVQCSLRVGIRNGLKNDFFPDYDPLSINDGIDRFVVFGH